MVNTLVNTIRGTYYDDQGKLLGAEYESGTLSTTAVCQIGSVDDITEQIIQGYSASEPLAYQTLSLRRLVRDKMAAQCDADEYVLYGADPRSAIDELFDIRNRGAIRITSECPSERKQSLMGYSVGHGITSR